MLDPCVPTDDVNVLTALKAAAERVRHMDETDRQNGSLTPIQTGISGCLRTAIAAFLAGVNATTDPAVWEGIVLVIQAEQASRQLEARIQIIAR